VDHLLVPPRDGKALAETAINPMKDEDTVHEMGLGGRKIAEEHDWKYIAKKTEELYEEVLDQKDGCPR